MAWVSDGLVGRRLSADGRMVTFQRPAEHGPDLWTTVDVKHVRRTWNGEEIVPEAEGYERRWDLRNGTVTHRYQFKGLEIETVSVGSGDQITTFTAKSAGRYGEIELAAGQSHAEGAPVSVPDFDLAPVLIDGPVEDQQAINIFRATLAMSTHPDSKVSVSPYGTSSGTYGGRVFWDAEMWVFPSLLLLDPARAKTILDYRLARPTPYPWQSGRSGTELAPPEFRNQIHVNGAVLWALHQGTWFGLASESQVAKIEGELQTFWRGKITPNADGAFDLKNVMGVDEWKLVDNELYTNLLAQWTLNRRSWERSAETPQLNLPKSDRGFIAYEGERQKVFKQANVLLSVYPLQNPDAERQATNLLARYAAKLDPLGPAMGEAMHATARARFGDPDLALEEWRRGWRPFLKDGLFSEFRNKDTTVFVTGAGGCLQTVLYGFAGFRIDYQQNPDAKWSMPLRNGGWLNVNPRLPKIWKRITLRGVQILDQRLTFDITNDQVRVKEGDGR